MKTKNRRENIDPAETKHLNQLWQFSELRHYLKTNKRQSLSILAFVSFTLLNRLQGQLSFSPNQE
jgi:hypothetical protein